MHTRLIVVLILHLISINVYAASKSALLQQVEIADPYIEMHTGAGGGYPIFHVIERGELIEIIQQRSTWFKVRNTAGLEGWVSAEQMTKTIAPNGEPIEFKQITQDDYVERNWELGVLGGDYGGAPLFSIYSAYMLNRSFATELSYTKAIASSSSSAIYKIGVFMLPFPEMEYSPYFYLGTGIINFKPAANALQPPDLSSQFTSVSFGIRTHLTEKVIVRLEYSNYVLFNANKDNDINEENREWKAGFAVFF